MTGTLVSASPDYGELFKSELAVDLRDRLDLDDLLRRLDDLDLDDRLAALRRRRRDRRRLRDLDDLLNDHELWCYGFDNRFAKDFKHLLQLSPATHVNSINPCSRSRSLLFSGQKMAIPVLCTDVERCKMCYLLCRSIDAHNSSQQHIEVYRDGSLITIGHNRQPILRLCSDIKSLLPLDDEIQISFPVLGGLTNSVRFSLALAWLQRCDSHGCKRPYLSSSVFPTNFLDVSDPNKLKLVTPSVDKERYIALSHCWGKVDSLLQGGNSPLYCTTLANLDERKIAFSVHDLPLTFQDAIEVARGLQVRYLWIDSLCIIQGPGGNWEQESCRMQDIYSSAYCTIAATTAVDSNSGFLRRIINTNSEHLCVENDLGETIYVCNDVANFDTEVDGAPLNTRAWIMQERLLSSRTIHFAANQMYWECGKGIYCEDFTHLTSLYGTNKYFKLDTQFPKLLWSSGYKDTLRFLEHLLKDYSKRGLTRRTDRVVALSGLANRIKVALGCKEQYGIFELYLHRNLLWRRQQSDVPVTRINYGSNRVPSWSWMACTGGIEFINANLGHLDVSVNLKLDDADTKTLIADLWKIDNYKLKQNVESEPPFRTTLVSSLTGIEIGCIEFDVNDEQVIHLDAVTVVGRSKAEHLNVWNFHVLILKRHEESKYQRAGFGIVQEGFLLWDRSDIRIV